jgi:hypothetical protein
LSAIPADGVLANDVVSDDEMLADRDEETSLPFWEITTESSLSDSLPAPTLRIFLLIAGALAMTSVVVRGLSRICAWGRRRRWLRARRERAEVFIRRGNGPRHARTHGRVNPAFVDPPRSTDPYEDVEETLREVVRARERRLSRARQRLSV